MYCYATVLLPLFQSSFLPISVYQEQGTIQMLTSLWTYLHQVVAEKSNAFLSHAATCVR